MCICMALFLVQDSFVKLASARMPVAQAIFIRGIIACVMIVIWMRMTQPGILRFFNKASLARGGVRAVFDSTAAFTYLWALFYLPLPNVSAINLSGPLMLTVLAIFFLGESVH